MTERGEMLQKKLTRLNALVQCEFRLGFLVTKVGVDLFSEMLGHMVVVLGEIRIVLIRGEFRRGCHSEHLSS